MKNNQFPGKIERHVTPRQRRHRVGAAAVGLGLTTGLIGFAAGTAVGARGMVPEAVGTCVGPVTPSEIEGGIGGLQDTLGTGKIVIKSKNGTDATTEVAKHLREAERMATTGIEDTFVPAIVEGDTFEAEEVAQGTCEVRPEAQFIPGPVSGRKDT